MTIYGILGAVNWVARRLQMGALMRLEADAMADLANEAFDALLGHGHDFFLNNFAGTLTRRVTRYSRSFEPVLDSLTLTFVPTILFAIGAVVILYGRNHWLGIIMTLWVVVFTALQIYISKLRHPLRLERAEQDSKMTGDLSDVIGNHLAVNLFAARAHEKETFARIVDAWRSATVRSWRSDFLTQAIQQFLAIAIDVGLIAYGVILWRQGIITAGDFILIQAYVLTIIDQVWNIGYNLRRLFDAFADASEMVDIMELPVEITDAPKAKRLKIENGTIGFSDVTFYYHSDRPILDHLDLTIEGGKKVALVGPSGAGKSTVVRLLLRQYDVRDGAIGIDGQDIRKVTQDSLHEAISFVPQEPVLFHRTLRENIAYGKRAASERDIIRAATAAHCHEFISTLPEGYDTFVGERGVKLSGGERQRVAIARAILKNAPILILDEATSSLDSESEALIQDALTKLMEDKTVIAIAHRLSTIMKMDQIIVMENGKVAITGTHEELLAHESNLYKKLWEIQAGGFIASAE